MHTPAAKPTHVIITAIAMPTTIIGVTLAVAVAVAVAATKFADYIYAWLHISSELLYMYVRNMCVE